METLISGGVCMGRWWGRGDPRWLKEGVTVISLLLRLTRQRALMGRAGSLLSKRLQIAHFTSLLGSQFKSHDYSLSSRASCLPCNTLILEKGTAARREGKGNPPGRGPAHRAPFVVTMETGIIGTKQRHVAWQQRSPRFITHTHTLDACTHQGTPSRGQGEGTKLLGKLGYPSDDEF